MRYIGEHDEPRDIGHQRRREKGIESRHAAGQNDQGAADHAGDDERQEGLGDGRIGAVEEKAVTPHIKPPTPAPATKRN